MPKAVLFDCGGVLVAPTTGDWVLGPGHEEVLGEAFADERLEEFRRVRAEHVRLLPDTLCMDSDEAEYAQFIRYYDAVLSAMGLRLTPAQLERLAWVQTFCDDRYYVFDDVLPSLAQWHTRYRLGIVSDAPPSTRRIIQCSGIMAHMDAATFSCDLGVLKPDPRIYQSTLDQLGVEARDAVFIDDYPSRLRGALAIGMRAVQMVRPMPARFKMPPVWDEGPVVYDFAGFDALLREMA